MMMMIHVDLKLLGYLVVNLKMKINYFDFYHKNINTKTIILIFIKIYHLAEFLNKKKSNFYLKYYNGMT